MKLVKKLSILLTFITLAVPLMYGEQPAENQYLANVRNFLRRGQIALATKGRQAYDALAARGRQTSNALQRHTSNVLAAIKRYASTIARKVHHLFTSEQEDPQQSVDPQRPQNSRDQDGPQAQQPASNKIDYMGTHKHLVNEAKQFLTMSPKQLANNPDSLALATRLPLLIQNNIDKTPGGVKTYLQINTNKLLKDLQALIANADQIKQTLQAQQGQPQTGGGGKRQRW